MINSVDKFLDEYKLKSADKTFLVGFSGGCDSLCLLDMLNDFSKKYSFKLVALHLNHNWRGEESLRDEENCQAFCERNEIEFVSETLEKGGVKTENAAREARYEFFVRQAKKYSNSSIFTAHTRTDNAETVIYRIIKGTGIKGLQGILPDTEREGFHIYRPLLNSSREDIEGYCISRGLVANTDSSNFDLAYKRNYIRHKVMPLFKEINFNAEKAIDSLAKIATSQCEIADEYLKLIKKDLFDGGKVKTAQFRQLSSCVMQKIAYDFCIRENLDCDLKKVLSILDFVKSNFNSKAGSKYSLGKDIWLFASSKYIYMITQKDGKKLIKDEIQIPCEGEYEIKGLGMVFSIRKFEEDGDFKFPPEDANFAYINLDNFDNLCIRARQPGDFISPFGMTGTMKLKKYLNAKGVFQHEKDKLILLCRDMEALWVANVGLSNKLRVKDKPTHVIEIREIK